MRSKAGVAGFICVSLLLFCTVSLAQSLYPVSTDQKVVSSTLIIEGKLLYKRSAWYSNRTMIYTTNEVEVYKVF